MSLSRPVRTADPGDHGGGFSITTRADRAGQLTIGTDHVEIDCHGMDYTHLDGLTHIGANNVWHDGSPASQPPPSGDGAPELVGANAGILTRVVLVDIPARRGTAWAGPEAVTGAEVDAAVSAAGLTIEPGDAVAIYMGRDRYEAAGHRYGPIGEFPDGRPGLDRSGAEFLADHLASVLCWDFLDAHQHGADVLPAHILAWAIGLVLVDNCHLGDAAAQLAAADVACGLLAVAPLRIQGATGCVVNPLLCF